MTDTDDTDVLLLIPPNFFLVQSSDSEDSLLESSRTVVHKPTSCTAQVIGKLVNQVQTLESRLESLEITSDISFRTPSRHIKALNTTESLDNLSLRRKCHTFPRRRKRKTAKRERIQDLSFTSVESFRTKSNVPHLKLPYEGTIPYEKNIHDIETYSMEGDLSSIVSTPSKKNDRLLLHEIDEFLTRVEAYESPEAKYKSHDNIENVIKSTGDYISQKIDSKIEGDVKLPSGKVVSSSLLDKYIYLVKNTSNTQSEKQQSPYIKPLEMDNQPQHNPPKLSENTRENDGKSPSMRRLNFDKEVQPTSTPKKQSGIESSSTFRPTSNKIYDRASKVLEQYRSNYGQEAQSSIGESYLVNSKRDFKMPQMRPFPDNYRDRISLQNKFMDSIDTDLLSLNELWGEKVERGERLDNVKLEEERLKREHCEAMIQQLQKKILDQQEKLAVAIRVDRAKDQAITKLREAWLKLTGSLDKAETRHQNALERMLREVDNFRIVADEAQKKTSHFESELYKALDLAHDYQEKCKQLTAEKKELTESHENVILNKNEVISNKDKEIEVLKENYETVMRLNKQSTDCVKNLEDALENEKLSHEQTRQKSNDLEQRIQLLSDEKTLVIQERDVLREKVNEERGRCSMIEKQLCDKQNLCSDLLKKCDFLDNETKTLRQHLEIQKCELKEHYQKQLEDAVLSKLQEFQHQLEVAERGMEHDARSKEDAMIDSYNKQISRIEEQHKLEIKVLEEKQKEEIKLYRLQLAQSSEKISLLESKLESYRRRRGEIASQLHTVMESQWRQALHILTNGATSNIRSSSHHYNSDTASTGTLQELVPPKVPPLKLPHYSKTSTDQRSTSTDMLNCDTLTDNELQQYVQMLLTKPPNFDTTADSTPPQKHLDLNEEPTSDRPDRHDKRDKEKDKAKRSLSLNKPPWKS